MSTPVPPATDSNPFRAPAARVAEPGTWSSSELLDQPRQIEAGSPLRWLSTGWTMFKEAPGPWVGMFLGYFAIMLVLGALPIIGILNNVLSSVLAGGLMLAAQGQAHGRRPAAGQLFDGFKKNTGGLALLGVLYLCAALAIALVAGVGVLGAIGAMAAGGSDFTPVGGVGIALFVLLGVILLMPLSLAAMWAPALVAIHDLQAVAALKLALTACVRNWMALVVFVLIGIALTVPIVLTLGLAALAIGPTVFIALWAGYRDVFVR
ncbi:MAG: BPSS1780 family membrane protein [Vicinamibacterales bacterium]